MIAPQNYILDVKNPLEAATQAYSAGAAIRNDQIAMQQNQAKLQQALQQQQMIYALATKKNPTAEDYAQVMTANPMLSEHLKRSWDVMDQAQKDAKFSVASQVYASLNAGDNDTAEKLLQDQIEGLQNADRAQEAKPLEAILETLKVHPESAKATAGLFLAGTVGTDKFGELLNKLGTERRADEKAPAEADLLQAQADKARAEADVAPERLALESKLTGTQIKKLDSDISTSASRLKLDEDALRSNIQVKLAELAQKTADVPDGTRNAINAAQVKSSTAAALAERANTLADKLSATEMSSGWKGSMAEFLKQATGNQDAVTELRKEYVALRNTEAIKSLPSGSASDADVKMAMSGFLSETADPDQIASFLRGMGKLRAIEAATESAKVEWLSSVGHMGSPKTDLEIDGVKIPAKMAFSEFEKRYTKLKLQEYQDQQAQKLLERKYSRFLTSTPVGAPK